MEEKKGLYRIGWVADKDTLLAEMNALASVPVTWEDLNGKVDSACKTFVNSRGYDTYDGLPVEEDKAAYLKIETGYRTPEGESVLGWFEKNKRGKWSWGGCGLAGDFNAYVAERKKYRIGRLVFDKWTDGEQFLGEIAGKALPEPWDFCGEGKHRILKSYLENVYERLLHEAETTPGKILYSADGGWLLFNTNLLDKFSHDIYIVAKRGTNDVACNPKYSKSLKERLDMGFTKESPLPPLFFKEVNEVLYQPSWDVDKEYDAFSHIIEERRCRFPAKYKDETTEALAKKLQDAIDFAVVLAQRNYKFIVPMYRPQTDAIQLLMPIYLEGIYGSKPDFALVLTLDAAHRMYIPETILTLDMCYNNARLIAKPDEAWLNPKLIRE